MPTTCPNCQRPVRTGARFCGFCGTSLAPKPASPATPASTAGNAAPATGPSGGYCPYCRAPLRAGVKFCSSCGKPLPGPAGEKTPASPIPPAAVPASAQKPSRERPKRKRSKGRLVIYIFLILILCLAGCIPLGVLAWPYASPYLSPYLGKILPFVFPTSTPTPTLTPVPTSTATEKPTPLPTNTPTPKLPDTLTPTPTLTQLPTDTNTPEPTVTLTPIPPISPLMTDQFTQPLTVTWDIWGEPAPVLVQDPHPALQLSSIAGSLAGVSGKPIITLSPGLNISFTATINTPTATLFLDWDAGVQIRAPGAEPGSVHLAIEPTQVSLRLIQASNNNVVTCSNTIRTEGTHTYLVQISADGIVSLYQDNVFACGLPGPVAGGVDNQGRISFSGNGTVENIDVFVQP